MLKNYKAQWRYRSSLGSFDEGEILPLEEEQAAHFNRDSPGVLVPVPSKSPEVEGRALSGPPQHRMMIGENTKNRSGLAPELENTEPEATDAAVKLAEEHGIDLSKVKGTGTGGRVIKSDVEGLLE